jgi:hypothetical protein
VATSLEVEPVGMHDVVPSPTGTNRLERRGDRWLFIRGRLKEGKTVEEARANLQLLMSRLAAEHPLTNKDRVAEVRSTNDVHLHPAADAVIVPVAAGVMVVVALVLLIACANVASMPLARASGRQPRSALVAMGASRARLVRQLVTEALVMSLIGAAAGTLLAWWATSAAASISLPLPIPLVFDLRIDGRVLLFTLLASLIAGVVAGLAPAIQASKPSLLADLRGEQVVSRGYAWLGGHRFVQRDVLVAGQIAVTAMLLVVAALLTRSLVAAQRTNVGFPSISKANLHGHGHAPLHRAAPRSVSTKRSSECARFPAFKPRRWRRACRSR